jgi:phosphatidylserine/phosphatidylglycerophosphate/cardiolipin synthase-like enzyme
MVTCYFSPSDNTNQKLIEAMAETRSNLDIQTMLITRSDLAYAIADAENRGVEVSVITNKVDDNADLVNDILLDVLLPNKYVFDDNAAGILHHKMALIDARGAGDKPVVITGSHNWSNSANDRNDENTLFIYNADIANQYLQQFAYRFEQNGGDFVVSAIVKQSFELQVYPNPASSSVQIESSEKIERIQLYNSFGILCVDELSINPFRCQLNIKQLQNGLYLLKVEMENSKVNTYKLIKN